MSILLQQLPALVGVLIGVLASYLATRATEHSRWRQERNVRAEESRLTAYAECTYLIKRKGYCIFRIAAERGFTVNVQPVPLDRGLEELAQTESERMAKWERVLLLGEPQTIAAIRRANWLVDQLQEISLAPDLDQDRWNGIFEEIVNARHDVYAAARGDLGFATNKIPSGSSWLWGNTDGGKRPE